MMVKEVMRPTRPVPEEATLFDVLEAIQSSGSEVVPIVEQPNGSGSPVVRQLVAVRDLPKLTELAGWGTRGHAVGRSVQDLLAALGRRPGRIPTVTPKSALADAWGLMCEQCLNHLPVVEDSEVVGIVSLVVTWSEFPYNSPTAGFVA